MKPFYYDKFLVEMNYKEAGLLRAACDHMRWINQGFAPEASYEQLYNDLTKILEKIPF